MYKLCMENGYPDGTQMQVAWVYDASVYLRKSNASQSLHCRAKLAGTHDYLATSARFHSYCLPVRKQ